MSEDYQVLARKYRPGKFADLLGQDALVRTVQNSIRLGKVAHAFMLTGVRGVGKTTTARIIAKALNCEKATDGKPVEEPCNECESCRSISEDRHLDVLELDAASHTGIDDIRELTEKAGYKPAIGRTKVYILDEVHMLSKNAFNGLLKTLEEPPPQVVFILATTDVEKVPVTILSRCQRFDLARVKMEVLQTHFKNICDSESVKIGDEALRILSMNAEGSVRDGLSLLEQAAAIGGGDISAETVREMLGLADREILLNLFESVLQGDAAGMLDKVRELDNLGVDSLQIIKDLLDLDYNLTRMKLLSEAENDVSMPELERQRGKQMVEKLSVAALSRIWQVLFKGFNEVKGADNRRQALEMVLVRLLYLSATPTTDELMDMLNSGGTSSPPSSPPSPATPPATEPQTQTQAQSKTPSVTVSAPAPTGDLAEYNDLYAIKKMAESEDALLAAFIHSGVHVVLLQPPILRVRLSAGADADMLENLRRFLQQRSGSDWEVSTSTEQGEPTLSQRKKAHQKETEALAETDSMVLQVKNYFPSARIHTISLNDEA